MEKRTEAPMGLPSVIVIRGAGPGDLGILEDMLFEAFHWDPAARRPDSASFRATPEFRKLLADWGERKGDRAVVADQGNRPVGAAWYRFWSDAHHSYGYVDESVPELAMGVAAGHRSRGVGRALLRELIASARGRRVPALSLSVDPANFALRLYESLGFRRVGVCGTSLTMLLDLAGGAAP